MDHSGHEPERNRHECRKTTISLTTRRSVLRIGHALLTLLRLGVGRPVHLHLDDTGLVSDARKWGTRSGATDHGRTGEVADDQDTPPAVQSVHIFLPTFPAKTSALGSGQAPPFR